MFTWSRWWPVLDWVDTRENHPRLYIFATRRKISVTLETHLLQSSEQCYSHLLHQLSLVLRFYSFVLCLLPCLTLNLFKSIGCIMINYSFFSYKANYLQQTFFIISCLQALTVGLFSFSFEVVRFIAVVKSYLVQVCYTRKKLSC